MEAEGGLARVDAGEVMTGVAERRPWPTWRPLIAGPLRRFGLESRPPGAFTGIAVLIVV
ncbi:hypothetical protein [Sphaerisporangium flaviroseum]|uniref:hypothetical protein n=1 Tax=Sphaerisporangium flaviroseum TaxID=509199 RepID=UPI0031ECA9D5